MCNYLCKSESQTLSNDKIDAEKPKKFPVEKVKKTVSADTETQTEGKKKRRVKLKIDKSLPELDFVR